MRSRTTVVAWVVAVIVVIAIVVGAWFWHQHQPMPAEPPPSATPAAPAPTAAEPAIQHPITNAAPAPAAASTVPLPPLDTSDADVTAAIARLTGDAAAAKLLANGHLIPRMVATIDALPRHEIGSNILPLRPPAGSFATQSADGRIDLAPSNYARYASYMKWVGHADTGQLVAWYVRYYPLFQKAYEQLGYPKGYFNDRLVDVIDDLLQAPQPKGPIALVKTDSGYAFADPRLEGLSVGQKLLVRMGPANETRLKAKLRAIRAAVTGQHGPARTASAARAGSAP